MISLTQKGKDCIIKVSETFYIKVEDGDMLAEIQRFLLADLHLKVTISTTTLNDVVYRKLSCNDTEHTTFSVQGVHDIMQKLIDYKIGYAQNPNHTKND